MDAHIRWMMRRDWEEVIAIERDCFEFPWQDDDFARCLSQNNCIAMVAEHRDRVVGFMVYALHLKKLHILNFAVHSSYRRKSIGSQLIRRLISKLCPSRRSRIVLEVRETNLAAQLFFQSHGFRAITVLRDFYEDTSEDAYLMQYSVTAADPINRIGQLK